MTELLPCRRKTGDDVQRIAALRQAQQDVRETLRRLRVVEARLRALLEMDA
jgi:hypothetical protein